MTNTESKISKQIKRAGFELRFQTFNDADQATISIDQDCFAQIIINLVDNAIKFSKAAENKVIEVSSKLSKDGRILFSVRDYGQGIPKDQMKKIFLISFILITAFGKAQQSKIQSGPMLGYSEMKEVTLWIQTKESSQVQIIYWDIKNKDKVFKTEKIKTDKAKAYTAKLMANQVEPGNSYEYRV